jgi:4-diphosphocytidyl-2-C-methyl-D-erythritol kinase
VQLEIEKNAAAEVAQRADNVGSFRDKKLQTDFEKTGMRRKAARELDRCRAIREIERDNDARARIGGGGLRLHRVPKRLPQPMQLFAPAKFNLRFKILRRRADGFHEIETLMTPISLGDEITIEPNDAAGIAFSCDDPSLPADENNLVLRAARNFFGEIKGDPRVRIELRKKIPHGAGLGGGSSDAASTLLGLNKMHGSPLPIARLTTLGTEIGSDVPFFLAQSAAICRGRGEIVEPVANLPAFSLLLLKPEFGVPTPWAYQRWRDSRELPGVDYGTQSLGELRLENDLERPAFEKYLFLARVKGWLREQPEVSAALLSGSGSTVFAVLKETATGDKLAARARAELDPELWTCASFIR